MKDFKVLRWFSCSIALFIILCTGMATAQATTQKPSDAAPVSQTIPPENSLLQFSAGGHILGFKPDRVYFASFDHAIVEEFVGTKGVTPVANSRGFKPEAGIGNPEGNKGAPQLRKVVYENLWQGITLQYEAKNNGIAESTYLLEPEADVKSIKLKYNVPVGIEKDGSLRFRHPSENGYFSQSAPKAWQDIEGKRTHIEVAFADYGDNTIGFRLGEYDRKYPVIIDPTYSWHTFYGSVAGIDNGYGIAVDTGGNVYITGNSNATWNAGAAAPLNAYSGSNDIVVLKLNTSGAYQWHTFYGSVAGIDNGYGIAVDTGGNVYITGSSNATWNGPGAVAPLNAYSGSYDIVVLKLNTSGAYQWHTFYGSGANVDSGSAIAVDTGGNVYVTEYSWTTWNGPGAVAPLNAHSGGWDIVVLKLNTNGAYQWHTFYGSAIDDRGFGIAVDTGGNVYVTGEVWATWNGPGAVAPLNAYSGGWDIVVLKLNTNGAYQWHTFYGSAVNDYGYGITVDTGGNVYISGRSDATWNGPAAAPLNAYSGSNDIVVLKLNTSGAYQWHTFYGSVAGADSGGAITVDTVGNVYVTGDSNATWNGPGATAPLNAFSGSADIVVLKLNASGAYQWHTFYGSVAGADYGSGIAVDTVGNVYVTGRSNSTWNGPGAAAPLNAYSGQTDIGVLKMADPTTYTVTPSAGANGTINPSTPQTINSGSNTTFTVTPNAGYTASVGGTCGGSLVGTTYTTNAITANCTVSASFFATATTYMVTKTADTADGVCDADCSLREAITASNAGAGGYTIVIPSGTYTTTIAGTVEDLNATGDYDIRQSVTIVGAGASTTTINGGGLDRVLHITGAYTVSISGVTIANGLIGSVNVNQGYKGGGIYNGGTLNVSNSSISSNVANGSGTSFGGGIYNGGTLNVSNSSISDNSMNGDGTSGGGIYNGSMATVSNTTITRNTATGWWDPAGGGGIANSGTLTVVNSTISGNTANGNYARGGGGILYLGGSITLSNTIVANQAAGADCSGGGITSGGHNLASSTSCGFTGTGDLQNTNPLLGALANNGGPTQTMALGVGSPAIDAGDNAICAAAPVSGVDQRGYARPSGAVCDIGAFEYGAVLADTTPDAFTFTDQTGAALSTVMTSNAITIAGINSAASISITGGEYKINSGAWTSVSGTVNNGNTVTVRQTSSGSNSTVTNAVLTIGGVSDTFSVTTKSTHTITPTVTGNGTITPAGPVEASPGGTVVFTMSPGVTNVIVDGVSLGAMNMITFKNVTGPHTLNAVY